MSPEDDDSMEVQGNDAFYSTWKLDPARSEYESGAPPQSGTYHLEPDGNGVKVTMEWVTADGQRRR